MTEDASAQAASPRSWCCDVVQDVSRSFALSIDLLEEPMASRLAVGYLLCRIPDTIEDAGHIPTDAKVRLLDRYDAALDPTATATPADFRDAALDWQPDATDADWNLVANTPRVFAAFDSFPGAVREAMLPPIRELVGGVTTYVARADGSGLRIRSRRDLEDYCYYVAGTVGHLITNLVALNTDADTETYLRDRAESFGLLLQLVNISKDVYEDYHEEDSVFLPREWLAAHDVPQEEVCNPEYRDGARAVVRKTITHARSYIDDAHEWLTRLDAEREASDQDAWALPYLLAIATLRELDENVDDVFTDRSVKVSREEVFALLSTFATDDPDLDALRQRVAAEPYTG